MIFAKSQCQIFDRQSLLTGKEPVRIGQGDIVVGTVDFLN